MVGRRAGKGLFNRISILDVLPDIESRVKEQIQRLPANYLLNASEEDLVASLTAEYTQDLPVLDEGNVHVDYGEHQVDISQDPMRMISDRSRPFYIAGTRVTLIIPFTGDPNLLTIEPQNFTFNLGGSRAEIIENEIRVTLAGAQLSADRAKVEFDTELRQIKHNLSSLTTAFDAFHQRLPGLVRTQIQARKNKLLADANLAAAIGFPIKRRDGVPTTYAVPVQRRSPKIERPAVSTGPFEPEPVLAMAEYEEIIGIVRNMVRVMEQSPKAFEKMGEEDLRTHFLVQLNGQYEGRATGETFNYQGKTDILIKDEGRNIFIGECKFWGGEKQLSETLDQLLSYLSWRDTKAAVFIFNRNVNFTDVLSKIEEAVPKHKNFKRTVSKIDESTYRYVFHQNNDRNRELTLTVLAFDIPSVRV